MEIIITYHIKDFVTNEILINAIVDSIYSMACFHYLALSSSMSCAISIANNFTN